MFNQVRKEEPDPKWRPLREMREKKVFDLMEACRPGEVPHIVEEVEINDEDLIEKFRVSVREPEEMKAFLRLPVGLRLYLRMESVQDETGAEETATIERWNVMNEEEELSSDEIRKNRDREKQRTIGV